MAEELRGERRAGGSAQDRFSSDLESNTMRRIRSVRSQRDVSEVDINEDLKKDFENF